MAGLHFFSSEPEAILALLREEFSQAPGSDSEIKARAALFGAIIQKNLNAADPAAVLATRGAASQLVGEESADGRAAILVREGVVSLYRPSHIRADNLDSQAAAYSRRLGCPVLGAALQGGENFTVIATDGREESSGYYWFELDDCQPADAEEICALIGRPAWEEALDEALDSDDAESLLAGFEKATGLTLCAPEGLSPAESWPGAVVYRV